MSTWMSKLTSLALTLFSVTVGIAAVQMVSAAAPAPPRVLTAGKSSAAMEISFRFIREPQHGVPTPIEVTVVPRVAAQTVSIQAVPSVGLVLISTDSPQQVAAVEPGKAYRYTFSVMAAHDGVYHLGLIVTLATGDTSQTRAASIKVEVGTPAVQVKQSLRANGETQPIESLPAIETLPK